MYPVITSPFVGNSPHCWLQCRPLLPHNWLLNLIEIILSFYKWLLPQYISHTHLFGLTLVYNVLLGLLQCIIGSIVGPALLWHCWKTSLNAWEAFLPHVFYTYSYQSDISLHYICIILKDFVSTVFTLVMPMQCLQAHFLHGNRHIQICCINCRMGWGKKILAYFWSIWLALSKNIKFTPARIFFPHYYIVLIYCSRLHMHLHSFSFQAPNNFTRPLFSGV